MDPHQPRELPPGQLPKLPARFRHLPATFSGVSPASIEIGYRCRAARVWKSPRMTYEGACGAGGGARREMTERGAMTSSAADLRSVLIPLALAQFICSFAGSNMNVMLNDISADLNTTVRGVQTAITVFLLVMAALMIPGGKLTNKWGRKRCFVDWADPVWDRSTYVRGRSQDSAF